MDNLELIDRWEAQALLGVSMSRLRQLYGPEALLTKYVNSVGRLRLSRAEVLALKHQRDTFRPVESSVLLDQKAS